MDNKQRYRVMVIDDDVASSFITTCQLEESNAFTEPLVYTHPDLALRYLQSAAASPAANNPRPLPDVILLDVNMPGMDGFEFLNELLHLCPEVRAVTTLCILTISQHPRDKQQAQAMGVDLFLEKPFTEQDVQQIKQAAAIKRGLIEKRLI